MSKLLNKINTLAVKIPLLFVLISLGMVLVFLAVMDKYGSRLLLDVAKQQVRQSGEAMVSTLGKRLTIAETVVNSVANTAESLPADDTLHHNIIKSIINYDQSEHYIAGGGVWPEPLQYKKDIERRSFFWARNQEDQLQYIDDYNAVEGRGYHHEEWYAPSKFLEPGQVYWSRSYMDPYSHEAMVTVTAAMYRDSTFYGAATIDLSLDGIGQLLARESAKFNGYAYALDRNGTFISFPDESISKEETQNEDGELEIKFANIRDVSSKNDHIPDVTATLVLTENISRLDSHMNIRAKKLASSSYQIDLFEAHRIVSTLGDPLKYKTYGDTFIKEFVINYDPILMQSVIINVFHIPKAYWKVITVTPMKQVTATSDKIIDAVITGFIFVIAIGLSIGFLALHVVLIKPLKSIYLQTSIDNNENGMIEGVDKGELGALAKRFNAKTQELVNANKDLVSSLNRAEKATLAKTQFLANMSHEIRTPMNGVNGMINLLKKTDLTEQQAHFANVAKSCSDSLLLLINDILDFSKIESGKLDIESIDFNIRETLNHFFISMVHLAEKKNVELVLDLSGLEIEWIKGDPGRIQQILTNLISNAIKFTENGYVLVKIGVKDINEMGLILYGSVTDTGIGIKAEKTAMLFESFSQADASTTREYGGTGLGLSICKQLCELMSGSISVKSELGVGSKFEFTLTLTKSEKQGDSDTVYPCVYKKILLYDENSHSEKIIETLLRKMKVNVLSVNTIGNAIKELSTGVYDVFIIDIRRLDFDNTVGANLIKVSEICKSSDTEIIAMVLATSDKTEQDYKNLGCDRIISKPIIDTTLYNVVNELNGSDLGGSPVDDSSCHLVLKSRNEIDLNQDEMSLSEYSPKILLVEDNFINQEVALGLLDGFNLTARVVNNGQEALDLIKTTNIHSQFDLILMDCQMPIMDGYETTRRIRSNEAGIRNANIPIIAMTANAMMGDEEKCLSEGMNDYIPKPIDQTVLYKKLKSWIEK